MRRRRPKGRPQAAPAGHLSPCGGAHSDSVFPSANHFASVLLVEDDRDIREAVASLLEAEGYTVLTAAHGKEALAILERGQPCVVLLDLMMPVMSGWDFMDVVRKNKRLEDIPVVVVSAYSERKAEGCGGC